MAKKPVPTVPELVAEQNALLAVIRSQEDADKVLPRVREIQDLLSAKANS